MALSRTKQKLIGWEFSMVGVHANIYILNFTCQFSVCPTNLAQIATFSLNFTALYLIVKFLYPILELERTQIKFGASWKNSPGVRI